MTKRASTKRLSSVSHSASKSIDNKARKRIEHLYELTDEIINAYNEINEKYVNQIYRKYRQLQQTNQLLKEKLKSHHCVGCKCAIQSNVDEAESDESVDDDDDDDGEVKMSAKPSSSTVAVVTRSKKNNPFIISDIEDTQNFDANDSRFKKTTTNNDSDNDSDNDAPLQTHPNGRAETKSTDQSGQDSDEDVDDGNDATNAENSGMGSLPLALQNVIKRKAKKSKNSKAYLLQIPHFPALCEFLRDKSHTSFDHRPTESQVRPLIEKHLSPQLAKEAKIRMRLRDELREIHRSYMRTFMNDPRAMGTKGLVQKQKQLAMKKSPM